MRYQNRKKREVTQLALDKVENAIELRGITKTFGSVVANDHIDLDVRRGEILALLGENGSGKTTLMNMISGIYHPDEGSIHVNGREVVINSPMDAKKLGIGMIHQHFKLVDVFSAMDNVVICLLYTSDVYKRQIQEPTEQPAQPEPQGQPGPQAPLGQWEQKVIPEPMEQPARQVPQALRVPPEPMEPSELPELQAQPVRPEPQGLQV